MARKFYRQPQCMHPGTHHEHYRQQNGKPIIIYLLSNGPLRFGMLNALMPSISKKVLTNQLKEMESDGLLLRESFAETPPRVEYSLTEKSIGLLPALKQLSDWANQAYPDIAFEECRIIVQNNSSL